MRHSEYHINQQCFTHPLRVVWHTPISHGSCQHILKKILSKEEYVYIGRITRGDEWKIFIGQMGSSENYFSLNSEGVIVVHGFSYVAEEAFIRTII